MLPTQPDGVPSVVDGAATPEAPPEAGNAPRHPGRIALSVSLTISEADAIESVRNVDGLASGSAAVRRLIRDGLMYRRIRQQIAEQEAATTELLYRRIREQITEHEATASE